MYLTRTALFGALADLDLVGRKSAGPFVDPLRLFHVEEAPAARPEPFGAAHRVNTRKQTDAFQIDGVGDDKDLPPGPVLLLALDQQPGDTTTQATLTVDGPHIVSTIESIGDFDFFRVELEAGQYYNIGQFLVTGGPSGVPLSDAYIELYNADGDLIVTADGGGANTPSGLDALLTYQATYTGTYYINARAFDQEPTNGTNGDAVGDYEVFVDRVDPNDPNVYRPLYAPDQPMHSIDWGSQVDRTSRNPDGDNGPRENGAPDTGVTYNAQFDIYGKNVITYYFAKTGDLFIDENLTTPGSTDTMVAKGFVQWEKDAFRAALDEYERVTDNIYIEVSTREEADFKFVTYNGTPGVGASLLGRMSPPNEENEGQAEFNAGDVRWTQEGISQGGFYFPTLLHELGHGHGMAHPHDNGGRSSVMPGADGGTGGIGGGYGDWGLSQQVFTIMSYNDGWNEGAPYGERPLGHGGPRSGGLTGTEVDHYGWVGTLSALDIAVLQDKYGVNEEWAAGNDVYTIGDVNGPGQFYSCIWDAAGTDEIKYVGARDAYIDLRAATLKYEEGGGGWVSYAMGAWTGFTIANGVTIENASGGSGADTLVGNDAANVLAGNDGNDDLRGNAGADTLNGGAGADTLIGGVGADKLNGGDGVDTVSYADAASGVTAYISAKAGVGSDAQGDVASGVEVLVGSAHPDKLYGDAVANDLRGGDGGDNLDGAAGNDRLDGGNGDDFVLGGAGDDFLIGGSGADRLNGGAGGDTADYSGSDSAIVVNLQSGATSGGHAQGDVLTAIENLSGSAFGDTLYGNSAANTLNGGGGGDILSGGAGNDRFVFQAGQGNGDIVFDFAGNGAAAGDAMVFEGYGSAADGAHVTRIDLTHWQVSSADGLINDIITLANGATIDQSDYIFS
jgi:serralysin